MKWTHKLNEEEFKLFKDSLKKIFDSINAELILEDAPIKFYESVRSIGKEDYWESYNYNIKINSKLGKHEFLEGFIEDNNMDMQIKRKAKSIGMEYCLKYDLNRNTKLADAIEIKENLKKNA